MVINMEREVTKIYKREKIKNRDRNIKLRSHMEGKQTDRQTNPCPKENKLGIIGLKWHLNLHSEPNSSHQTLQL